MKRFSDFATTSAIVTGDKIKIEDILDKEIEVTGYKISDTKFQKHDGDKLLTLQFRLDGIDRILFTGSNVLIEQITKYENEIPFATKIIKVNKFYTFN